MSQHPSSPMFGRPDTLLSSAMAMDGSGLQLQQQQQSQNQSLALPLALTRNQYSIECGGVLLDPATNEVCLLFYPDTSEWRLPMGKPDAMGRQGSPPAGTDASVAGCEPPAHAAQRQITLITGYRCTHVHPAVAAGTPPAACAYIGPRMVEPLALQIEQRVVAQCETPVLGGAAELPNATSSNNSGLAQLTPPASGSDAAAASALSPATAAADDDYQLPRTPSTRLVMTYYYTAWLTQSRFEAKAATLPVGPAGSTSAGNPPAGFEDGVLTTLGATAPPAAAARDGLPLAEVTWFKMDTAAQVLTHESDKLALREAIHRMSRLSAAEAASQARYSALALAQHSQTAAADSADLLGANQGRLARGEAAAGLLQLQPAADAAAIGFGADSGAAGVGGEAQTANETAAESAASASASSSSSSSLSDGATKADDSAVAKASSASRPSNLDIIRKTATSITKRGGSLFAKSKAAAVGANDAQSDSSKQLVSTKSKRQARQNQSQSQSQQQPSSSSSPPNKQHFSAAAVSAATSTTANGKQAIVPRVMSIFYKLVGPSSSSSSNNNSNASNAAAA
ncbi:hypothetical protein LPJ72_004991 [Coemansia sp. Benny D160-2]|nr:hypothetical protein LPJ72_004991 [Coemansia sp. Benny D160-2]